MKMNKNKYHNFRSLFSDLYNAQEPIVHLVQQDPLADTTRHNKRTWYKYRTPTDPLHVALYILQLDSHSFLARTDTARLSCGKGKKGYPVTGKSLLTFLKEEERESRRQSSYVQLCMQEKQVSYVTSHAHSLSRGLSATPIYHDVFVSHAYFTSCSDTAKWTSHRTHMWSLAFYILMLK